MSICKSCIHNKVCKEHLKECLNYHGTCEDCNHCEKVSSTWSICDIMKQTVGRKQTYCWKWELKDE